MFVAGIPSRWVDQRPEGTTVLSFSRQVVAQLILSLVGDRLPVVAKGFPPRVPLQDVRPLDIRWKPTMEIMPSVGEDLILVTVPSYFREPGAFRIEARLPEGKRCAGVRELVSDQPLEDVRKHGKTVEIDVNLTTEDFLKVYAFSLTNE